jgi:hypothetical protein
LTHRQLLPQTLAMNDLVNDLTLDKAAILFAVIVYVTKEGFQFIKATVLHTKDKTTENTQAVKELNQSIKYLSERLLVTEKKIEDLNSFQHLVWKLEKDVGYAFEKIRDLKS